MNFMNQVRSVFCKTVKGKLRSEPVSWIQCNKNSTSRWFPYLNTLCTEFKCNTVHAHNIQLSGRLQG